MMNNGMQSMNWNGMGGWMFLWWIFIIALIVAGVFFFIRQQRNMSPKKSTLDVLKKRYAKGDISKEKFEEKNTISHKN